MPSPQHSSASGTELHEDKRVKIPVRAASTANVSLSAPGATMDGVTLTVGDRVLLKDQTTVSQNGIYTWGGSAVTLVRTDDADSAADFVYMFQVGVREGTANGAKYYVYTQSSAVTLGTTSLTFAQLGGGGGTVSSVALTAPTEFSVAGSPVTSTGTLAITKANQSANTIYAGPASGAAAAPSFRTAVAADLPVMGASGASHAAGAVPDPGASVGTTKFLREDATWQVPSGSGGGGSSGSGGSGALVPIMAIGPLTATQATLPFAGIPQTGFRNLRLRVKARSTLSATNATIGVQANGDSGSTYSYEVVADASGGLNRLSSASATSAVLGYVPAATAPAGAAGVLDIAIPSYTDALQKSIQATGAFEQSTSAGDQFNQNAGGFWRSTSAITSLALTLSGGSFDVGSYACLYGEMDTAGVLLTPASNLLYDSGVLTGTQATIDTGTLGQAYRDLHIDFRLRTDAGSQTIVNMRFNGDTTAGHYVSSSAATGGRITVVASAGQTAGQFLAGSILVSDYANTTSGTKSSQCTITRPDSTVEGEFHYWTPTVAAAITSINFAPSTGNFVAGSVIRVYGSPVSAGGASTGTGARLRISANQSTTTGTATLINWDTEDADADNQHYTSAAALTGTVTKTSGSQTVTGSGTAFTTELSVGQVISVTGTATEKRVVTAIASGSSLTVNSPFVNTQAGATATRINSAVVFRQPGFYTLQANIYSAALASGAVTLAYYLNSLTTATSGTAIGQSDPVAVNASAGYDLVIQRPFQQWDFVEVVWTQNAGTVNVLADERTHWSISARPTVIVAVPYVCVEDQKTNGSHGGTFTSGADRTRDLNTIVSNDAGIASLAANQVTLPPGTYRFKFSAPAKNVQLHQAFLYNATASAEVKRGSSSHDPTTNGSITLSEGQGRVTITVPSAFEVRHRCGITRATDGFGIAAAFGTEVYTSIEFWKEG